MKARPLAIFYAVCVIICFATVVSWARSTMSSEGLKLSHGYAQYSLAASEGTFVFSRGTLVFRSDEIEQAWRSADPEHRWDSSRWQISWSAELGTMGSQDHGILGFGYKEYSAGPTRRVLMPGIRWKQAMIQVPHWAVLALFGAAPGAWIYRRSRASKDRVAQGLCRKCGFEMGNLYHSCPKCGERAPLPENFPVIEGRS